MKYKRHHSFGDWVYFLLLGGFFCVFIAGGLFCIILFSIQGTQTANWTETDSVITEIVSETTYVAYEAKDKYGNDHFFDHTRLDAYSSTWREGDTLPIKYNPDKISEITANGEDVKLIPILIGGLFIGVGGLFLTIHTVKFFKKPKLEEIIEATADDLEAPRMKEINVASNNIGSIQNVPLSSRTDLKRFVLERHRYPNILNFTLYDGYNHELYEIKRVKSNFFKGTKVEILNLHTNESQIIELSKVHYQNQGHRIDGVPFLQFLEANDLVIEHTNLADGKCTVFKGKEVIGLFKKDLQTKSGGNEFRRSFEKAFFNRNTLIQCKEEYLNVILIIVYMYSFDVGLSY